MMSTQVPQWNVGTPRLMTYFAASTEVSEGDLISEYDRVETSHVMNKDEI